MEELGSGDAYEWTVASSAWADEWATNRQSPCAPRAARCGHICGGSLESYAAAVPSHMLLLVLLPLLPLLLVLLLQTRI